MYILYNIYKYSYSYSVNFYSCDRNILRSVGGRELGNELVDKYRELYGSGYVR